jgi:hypothetical protein
MAMIATGLAAGAAFASTDNTVDVTLPQPVTVGKVTLPSGAYRINEVNIGSGESMFLFLNADGDTAAVAEAMKNADLPDATAGHVSDKTEVVLSHGEDGTMRLDKLFVQGDAAGYQFINTK